MCILFSPRKLSVFIKTRINKDPKEIVLLTSMKDNFLISCNYFARSAKKHAVRNNFVVIVTRYVTQGNKKKERKKARKKIMEVKTEE